MRALFRPMLALLVVALSYLGLPQ